MPRGRLHEFHSNLRRVIPQTLFARKVCTSTGETRYGASPLLGRATDYYSIEERLNDIDIEARLRLRARFCSSVVDDI